MTYSLPPLGRRSSSSPKKPQFSWWKSIRRFSHLPFDLGIDLGTSNTLIYSPYQGILLQESSTIAINTSTQSPIAVGAVAGQLLGRTSPNIRVCRPVRNGVVADLDLTQLMLQYFIRKAQWGTRLLRPRLLVGCSCGATEVERSALIEAAFEAGAREVALIDEPVAAALGAGLPAEKPHGNLIVDIGGGTTEMAVVCASEAVFSHAIAVAGNRFDRNICDYFRQIHQLHLGELTAENLKIRYGSMASNDDRDHTLVEIVGVNAGSGLPQRISIAYGELREALSISMDKITDALSHFLETIPTELMTDIAERGMMLTGGGALLPGLDTLIRDRASLPVHVAKTPLKSVALGMGKIFQDRHPQQEIRWAS
ncbi:rod shape-determining protein [Acaryochloris sp. CCMEE 5410]|uniref:rod shape-determining protein n=1 Tax=Acaryochloris sp. CCMEE 5410 TaxID=310037 RepID=UPI0002484ECE|nr:rod shape-determining protein [Acaryochloris sp. CCMEE 5410]KAI9132292.1 rod shape-determining protein [Acaryochloris sp. CCMEE 5410]